MKGSIDYRRITVKEICSRCEYFEYCRLDVDCAALTKLVRIYESLDNGNPDQ